MTTTPPPKEEDGQEQEQQQRRFLIEVSELLPTLQECSNFVSDPSCGAIATFAGITRNNFNGKKVLKLSYEGYVPMAKKELFKLCNDAITNHFKGIVKIAMVHILGDCPVGSPSCYIAASSPHRQEAIQCIEYLINELKARIPIWKREVYEEEGKEGSSVWKENIEWKEGRQQRVMKQVVVDE